MTNQPQKDWEKCWCNGNCNKKGEGHEMSSIRQATIQEAVDVLEGRKWILGKESHIWSRADNPASAAFESVAIEENKTINMLIEKLKAKLK